MWGYLEEKPDMKIIPAKELGEQGETENIIKGQLRKMEMFKI